MIETSELAKYNLSIFLPDDTFFSKNNKRLIISPYKDIHGIVKSLTYAHKNQFSNKSKKIATKEP